MLLDYPKIRKGADTILVVKRTGELIAEVILSIFVIICVGALPTLFHGISFNFVAYLVKIKNIFLLLLNPQEITYGFNVPRSIFPQIFILYKETFILIAISIVASTILAFALTYLILLVFQKVKSKIKWFLTVVESLPDIFFIIIFQFLTIIIFKQTGMLMFNVASAGDERAFFLPILCLTTPLTILLTKFLILQFEKEEEKMYVEYAVSKGMAPFYIFNVHILKNVLFSLYHYSKTAIWFVISNMIIVEYMFNVSGIIYFIYDHFSSEVFVVGILMIYLPIFLFYRISEWLFPAIVRGEAVD